MIKKILSTQFEQLQLLCVLLEEEKIFLISRDVDGLIDNARRKQQVLDNIHFTDTAISEHADREQLTHQPELKSLRHNIDSLLAQCQKKNAVNGKIIEATSQQVSRLAETLNQLAKRQSVTYDRLGKHHGIRRSGKSFKA
jgi:flagella synthesis protein FlgN